MREILFRGKLKDSGNWAYGDLVRLRDGQRTMTYIYGCGEVDPDTVCEYTGLTDKNGKKIFEGDLAKVIYQSNYVGVGNIDFGASVVEYCGSYYGAASYQLNTIGEIGSRSFTASLDGGVTVIGNMFDSPELLNGWSKDKKGVMHK